MPPKTKKKVKKKTKKGKKKKKTKKQEPVKQQVPQGPTKEKEDRIALLTDENETLKSYAYELKTRLARAEEIRLLMIDHNTKLVNELRDRAQTMTEQTEDVDAKRVRDTSQAEEEKKQVKGKFQKIMNENASRHHELMLKYDELRHLEKEQADLETHIHKLETTLAEEIDRNKQESQGKDRRNMEAKETLKNEMLIKIRETKSSLLAMTEDKLHQITKKTISDYEKMSDRLYQQSAKTEQVDQRNRELEELNRDLRRQMELSQDQHRLMVTRTRSFEKKIKRMTARLAEAEGKTSPIGVLPGAPPQSKQTASVEMMHKLESQLKEISSQKQEAKEELEQLRAQLSRALSGSRRIMQQHEEATAFLELCLQDLQELTAKEAWKWNTTQPLPPNIKELAPEVAMGIVQSLLERMALAAANSEKTRDGSLGILPAIRPAVASSFQGLF